MLRYIIFATVINAQPIPTVSFSPQGAELLRESTGRNIAGFQLVGVEVCSPVDMTVKGSLVYVSASNAHLSWKGPNATKLILSRVSQFNWRNTAVIGLPLLTGTAAIVIGSGSLNISQKSLPKVEGALTSATGVGAALIPVLKSRAPDPSGLIADLIDPKSDYRASPCFQGLIGAAFPGPGSISVPLPQGEKK